MVGSMRTLSDWRTDGQTDWRCWLHKDSRRVLKSVTDREEDRGHSCLEKALLALKISIILEKVSYKTRIQCNEKGPLTPPNDSPIGEIDRRLKLLDVHTRTHTCCSTTTWERYGELALIFRRLLGALHDERTQTLREVVFRGVGVLELWHCDSSLVCIGLKWDR